MRSAKKSFWSRAFSCALLLSLAACTSTPTKEATPYGPGLPDTTAPGTPPPEASSAGRKIPVGLVFGGNGVASFATVGVLKKLSQEGIVPEYIVASGWSAVFAVGYGLMGSTHDLEWFAMKLQEKDLGAGGFFDFKSKDEVSQALVSAFGNKDLSRSRVPLVIMAPPSNTTSLEVYDRGDWRFPVGRSLGFPGLGRPFPTTGTIPWGDARVIDVGEGVRRGAERVMAFSMYSDYVDTLVKAKEADARNFGKRLDSQIAEELRRTGLSARIRLGRAPMDFSAKRAAIQAGYRAANTLMRQLRRRPSSEEQGPQEAVPPGEEAPQNAVD